MMWLLLPVDGRIIVSGIESSTFTQEDLTKGVVSYEHSDQSLSSKDSFAFTVQAKGWSTEGTFRIKIFKNGYLSQPKVVSNLVILAYEGEHSVIDTSHLEVKLSFLNICLKILMNFSHSVGIYGMFFLVLSTYFENTECTELSIAICGSNIKLLLRYNYFTVVNWV